MPLNTILRSPNSPKLKTQMFIRLGCYIFGFYLGMNCRPLLLMAQLSAFHSTSHSYAAVTLLERLKNDDKMKDITNKLIGTRLDGVHESSLKRFFSSTITRNVEKRESGIGILVDLFGQER
jgi:hypothetical protein